MIARLIISVTGHLAAMTSRAKPKEVVPTAASRRIPFARRDIVCGTSSMPSLKILVKAADVVTSAESKRIGGYTDVSSSIDGHRPVRDTRDAVYLCC